MTSSGMFLSMMLEMSLSPGADLILSFLISASIFALEK